MSNKNFFTSINFVDDDDYSSDASDASDVSNVTEVAEFDAVKIICCEEFQILDQAIKSGISWYDLMYPEDNTRAEILKKYLKNKSTESKVVPKKEVKEVKQAYETESNASEDTWVLIDKTAPLGKRSRNQNKSETYTEKYPIRKQKQTAPTPKKSRT